MSRDYPQALNFYMQKPLRTRQEMRKARDSEIEEQLAMYFERNGYDPGYEYGCEDEDDDRTP